jgi:hypothetical protein
MILFGYSKATGLTSLGEIEQADADRYGNAIRHLRAFDHSSVLLHLVREADAKLQVVISSISACDPLKDDDGWDRMTGLELAFDEMLINLLTAFRTYLDHTESRLKRQYGQNSPQLQAFKSATAAAFDGTFEYRFMYKLRNFIQHSGFPDWRPWIDAKAPTGQIMRFFGMLEPTADPMDLLQADGDVWGVVRADLTSMSARIPIRACANVVVSRIENIEKRVHGAEEPELRASVQCIDRVVGRALNRGEYPMVAEVSQTAGTKHMTFLSPPRTVMVTYGTRIPDGP